MYSGHDTVVCEGGHNGKGQERFKGGHHTDPSRLDQSPECQAIYDVYVYRANDTSTPPMRMGLRSSERPLPGKTLSVCRPGTRPVAGIGCVVAVAGSILNQKFAKVSAWKPRD